MSKQFLNSIYYVIYLFSIAFISIYPQGVGEWQNYTSMSNTIKVIETDTGLWTATTGGLFLFNKADSSFEKFLKSDGLSSQKITALDIDKNNNLWIGYEEGFIDVFNYNDNLITTIYDIKNSSKTSKKINKILIKNDTAYIALDFGLSLISTEGLHFLETVIKFGNFPAETSIKNISYNDILTITTLSGFALLSKSNNISAPESWSEFLISDIPGVSSISQAISFNNKIYLATNNGIIEKDTSGYNSIFYLGEFVSELEISEGNFFSITNNSLRSIVNNNSTVLFQNSGYKLNDFKISNFNWMASDKGLIKHDGTSYKIISPNGPSANIFLNISTDDESNLWAASGTSGSGKGVYKLDYLTNSWQVYNTQNTAEFKSNDFHNLFINENDKYFCNWGNGFTSLIDNKFTTYDTSNTPLMGFPGDPGYVVISDVSIDSKGNLWVLNFNSSDRKTLSVLTHDNNWHLFEFGSPIYPKNVVTGKLLVDPNDTKWFSVVRDGLLGIYYFNENNTFEELSDDVWGIINVNKGLTNENVLSFSLDKLNTLWIGTAAGLNYINDISKPSSSVRSIFSLSAKTINAIAVDALNRKWLGTNSGVILISQDGIDIIAEYNSQNSPLPSNKITDISIDQKLGRVYIATEDGLTALNTEAVQPKKSFSDLFIYPNPYILSPDEKATISIDGLIKNSIIKVIDASGKLINEFSSPGGRIAFWNGLDRNGKIVNSGVYFIIAYEQENSEVALGKVLIIRK